MKVGIERCGSSVGFCDRCLSEAIRDGVERPCFVVEELDGKEELFLLVNESGEIHKYLLTPEQRKTVYEASEDLKLFELVDKEK